MLMPKICIQSSKLITDKIIYSFFFFFYLIQLLDTLVDQSWRSVWRHSAVQQYVWVCVTARIVFWDSDAEFHQVQHCEGYLTWLVRERNSSFCPLPHTCGHNNTHSPWEKGNTCDCHQTFLCVCTSFSSALSGLIRERGKTGWKTRQTAVGLFFLHFFWQGN